MNDNLKVLVVGAAVGYVAKCIMDSDSKTKTYDNPGSGRTRIEKDITIIKGNDNGECEVRNLRKDIAVKDRSGSRYGKVENIRRSDNSSRLNLNSSSSSIDSFASSLGFNLADL